MVEANEIEGHLLRRRIIILGHVDEKETYRVLQNLLRLQIESSDPAYLIIDSTGGSLYSAIRHPAAR